LANHTFVVLGFALRCQDGEARSVDQQRAQIRIAALPGQGADCSPFKQLPRDPASGLKTVHTVVWERVK
jgi:hypothetical protein